MSFFDGLDILEIAIEVALAPGKAILFVAGRRAIGYSRLEVLLVSLVFWFLVGGGLWLLFLR